MTTHAIALEVGTTAEPRTFGPLTRQMFVRYSGASGDLNPMHYDDTMATAAGFPSVFSQGMHQGALLATFATDWLGAANLRRFGIRFREQVWPGDTLTCTGTVVSSTPTGSGRLVTVDLVCARQTGGTALAGSADFLLDEGYNSPVTHT
ncbi:MaoC/PaaZ C-terminal domain-containing protein [Nocardia sp. NBC_00565]|uniref:MaoC/PaaZ C-terminal domain-containing protein n=1 Tax=Nocardia sp. NBC_00565 TaxID=2975993 RepID=UPI002E803B13|nr:MaoC/PaaZ C-terminal domain-containing protein [Nocardia sp. NBC_00565]WUC05670.1 MaoC/PaaZ C-terminal domain-containing protein [Nocardia sp. NBC_00565]